MNKQLLNDLKNLLARLTIEYGEKHLGRDNADKAQAVYDIDLIGRVITILDDVDINTLNK